MDDVDMADQADRQAAAGEAVDTNRAGCCSGGRDCDTSVR